VGEMNVNILEKAYQKLNELRRDTSISNYIDLHLRIPSPYIGKGPIKLFVLGQDPTVKNEQSRSSIKTVLNLDKRGSVLVYLSDVCKKLGIILNLNVYATNIFKNFFIQPPTQIKEIDIFQTFLPFWLPVLKEELALFPNIPVITLGQPVMQTIIKPGVPILVRDYWGYTTEWKEGNLGSFHFIKHKDNILGRLVFPFPHQPSIRKEFYKQRMDDYIAFMKEKAFPLNIHKDTFQ
jgi:hypothetical protein